MDFFAEDMGRVAMMRVTEKGAEFKGLVPKCIGNAEVAIIGNAKVVVVNDKSKEGMEYDKSVLRDAIRQAWVLVVNGDVAEDVAAVAHPYVTIVLAEGQSTKYAAHSRGWNVEDADTGTHTRKGVVVVGKNDIVDVLFGESRENPIGLLSIKCSKR